MNTKLLIALPILALLSISAVFLISHKRAHKVDDIPIVDDVPVVDVTPVVDETPKELTPKSSVSLIQWQNCYAGFKIPLCDDNDNEEERNACYAASSKTSQLIYPEATNELKSCVEFYAFQQKTEAQTNINQDGFYQSCFLNQQVLGYAKLSTFYYNRIFAPIYVDCAGY